MEVNGDQPGWWIFVHWCVCHGCMDRAVQAAVHPCSWQNLSEENSGHTGAVCGFRCGGFPPILRASRQLWGLLWLFR